MKLIQMVAILGIGVSTSVFAANSDKAAIDAVQKQIAQVQTEMHQALAQQQTTTQTAIANLQQQVQAQITHLQSEINQLQTQMTTQIKQVQVEIQKVNAPAGAPVVSATPGEPAAPAPATPEKK